MKRDLRKVAIVALAIVATGGGARAEGTPDAQAIVAAADQVRNPGRPFRLTSTLVEYADGKVQDRTTLIVYSKENQQTRRFSNLVRYVGPPRDTGKLVLMDDTNLWFYDPSSKASIRISPQQRLTGQASDGDVMTVNMAGDYQAKLIGPEKIQDADRRDCDCWHLDLTAAREEATYNRIEYWVDRSSNRPIKGKFYADSGILLKIAYYHKYEMALDGERPTETILIDAVNSTLVTTISTTDYQFQDIPDSWLQRDFLPRVPTQ